METVFKKNEGIFLPKDAVPSAGLLPAVYQEGGGQGQARPPGGGLVQCPPAWSPGGRPGPPAWSDGVAGTRLAPPWHRGWSRAGQCHLRGPHVPTWPPSCPSRPKGRGSKARPRPRSPRLLPLSSGLQGQGPRSPHRLPQPPSPSGAATRGPPPCTPREPGWAGHSLCRCCACVRAHVTLAGHRPRAGPEDTTPARPPVLCPRRGPFGSLSMDFGASSPLTPRHFPVDV